MMKENTIKLLLLLGLMIFFKNVNITLAQNDKLLGILPLEDGKVTYTGIEEDTRIKNIPKAKLYTKVKSWVSGLQSEKNIIQFDDPDTGQITAQGYLPIKWKVSSWDDSGQKINVHYTIRIFVGTGKYKYKITNFVLKYTVSAYDARFIYLPESDKEQAIENWYNIKRGKNAKILFENVNKEVLELIQSLKRNISEDNEDKTIWNDIEDVDESPENKKSLKLENLSENLVKRQQTAEDADHTFDFRKTKWGMTKKQVKATESAESEIDIDDENLLVYNSIVSGMNAKICYIFIDTKLVETKYLFTIQHTNPNNYITDYNDVRKKLIQKYGEPKEDKVHWKNEQLKNTYSDMGLAISMGYLAYYNYWETSSTQIRLLLRSNNYDIEFGVEYASREFEYREEKQEHKKEENEF